jgi:uncharacterized membrane protein
MQRSASVALALLGALGAAVQSALLLVRGEALCLNEGCRVVEGLTRVPPLFINLAGLGFFLAAAVLAWRAPADGTARRLLRTLLLAGIAAEGVLFSYQLLVAKAFCGWCLTVFALVVLLNLLAGSRQVLGAAAVFAAALAAFSALRFGAVHPAAGGRALDGGTYGVRRCEKPAKQLYLVFSSSCPHCAEVLRTLESCNSCNFHFNPIDRIAGLDLPGVERSASWDPAVNRELLALLGIDEVPALLVPGPEGMSIIRGEKRILSFIRAECFRAEPVLNVDPSRLLGDGSLELFRDEKDDGCNVVVDCTPAEKTADPFAPGGGTSGASPP